MVGSSMSQRRDPPVPALAADDLWRFGEGTHDGLAYLLGAHPDADGTMFRVWAPSARSVSVIGDFNGWSSADTPLEPSPAGIWSGRATGAGVGTRYKYRIVTTSGAVLDKSDPFAYATEEPPRTASVITRPRLRLGRRRLDGTTRRAQSLRRPDLELRGPSRIVAI